MTSDRIFFPNLNGVRAIAALAVVLHHIWQFLQITGKLNEFEGFVTIIGKLGVTLFFVLSGFLISYLLFAEEKKTGTIFIKDFYIRRMLRIWPLYYTIVILSFFILPHIELFSLPDEYWGKIEQNFGMYLTLFLLFLPNLALSKGGVLPYGSQSWSVGVEEQFYLIWPLLMKFFKNKLVVIFGTIIVYFVVDLLIKSLSKSIPYYIKNFVLSFQIYSMAIGGFFAYLAFYGKEKWQKWLLNYYVFVGALFIFMILIYLSKTRQVYYSIPFAIIIYNLACNPSLKTLLENKILNYLGKISYGIYMYHCIAIVFSIRLLDYLVPRIQYNTLQYKVTLVILVLVFTIFLSDISYRFMEKRFIKLKTKYSKIVSGDNASK